MFVRAFVVANDVNEFQVLEREQIPENRVHVQRSLGMILLQSRTNRGNDRSAPLDDVVQVPGLEHDPSLPAFVRIYPMVEVVQTFLPVPAAFAREAARAVADALQFGVLGGAAVEVVAEIAALLQPLLQPLQEVVELRARPAVAS